MGEQGRLLNEVADLIDGGLIFSTANSDLGSIDANNLKIGHALVESGKAIGKVVLTGFSPV
jgi:hypothetical protein